MLRGAEEALGLFQGVGIDTTGQHLAGARDNGVVGTGQTGDGVEQDDHVFLVLNQALGLLDHHFSDLYVARRRLVEGRGNHFAAHSALHFGYLFRALVDQQDDQVALGVVAGDVRGDVLQHQRLTGLGRRHQQAALAFADGGTQVDDARHQVFGGAVAGFHHQTLIGEQRRQVLEQDLVLGVFRLVEVDRVNLEQGEVALAVFRRANLAGNGVTGTQVEATNLAGRHIDVIRAGQVGGVGRAQEAEPVLKDLQYAVTEDVFAAFGMFFQDAEDHILLTRSAHVFQAHLVGDFQQFGNRFLFEVSQVHRGR